MPETDWIALNFQQVNSARQAKSQLTVKMNLELKAKRTRQYPELAIGDHVKVYNKKKLMDKERISSWSENKYEIIAIEDHRDQPFYKLAGRDKFYMRSEILKV